MLSGSGGLTKRGDGHLQLDAEGHSYSGPTRVLGGTLETTGLGPSPVTIAAAGRLLTHGNLGGSIDNGGSLHLAPGSSNSIAIGGDYRHRSDATLVLTAGDTLKVAGTAMLQGGVVSVVGKRDYVGLGQSHDILQAVAGVQGSFATMTAPATLFVEGRLDYRADAVSLTLSRFDVRAVAAILDTASPAALAAAQRLEAAFSSIDAGQPVAGGVATAAAEIQSITHAGVASATLDSLSGQLHGQAMAASFDVIGNDRSALAAQLAHGQGSGSWRLQQATSASGSLAGPGWQLDGWMQGHGQALEGALQAGVAVSQSRLAATATGDRGRDRHSQGHLWLASRHGNSHLSVIASSGRADWQIDRQLLLGSQWLASNSRYHCQTLSLAVEAGHRWQAGRWQLQPWLGVAWERLRSDGFAERDALGMGLLGAGSDMQRQLALAGLRIGGHHAGWQLDGQLQWQQVLASGGMDWQARFAGADAWAGLDTTLMQRSHGQAALRAGRRIGANANLLQGLEQRLGGGRDSGGASLQWLQRF